MAVRGDVQVINLCLPNGVHFDQYDLRKHDMTKIMWPMCELGNNNKSARSFGN